MDMPKLLIADSSDEYRQILFDKLSQNYMIKTCRSGMQALELLRAFRPDLMILDLMLPELDGITLLQRAHSEGIHPTVLVFCAYPGEYIIQALHRLGVAYSMTKPCDLDAVADRLSDLANQLQPVPSFQETMHSSVSNLLLSLNFSTRLDGFLFLQAAIPLYMKDPGLAMTKELYVAVGAMYNKDWQQVERSIRSAIDKAWQNRDDQLWPRYFRAPDGSVPRPSNSTFITRVSNALIPQGYGAKGA